MKLYPVRSIQLQIGKDIRVKLQTSPSVKSNFKGAEQILRPEGVADGSHHEVRGKWKLNSKTGILSFVSENELVEYQVEFNGKEQIWIPIGGSKNGFNKLYIKGLGL